MALDLCHGAGSSSRCFFGLWVLHARDARVRFVVKQIQYLCFSYLEARGRTDEAIRAIQFYHNAQKFAIDKALEEIHEDLETMSKPISMIRVDSFFF